MPDPSPQPPSVAPTLARIRLGQLAVFTAAATLVFLLAMLTPLRGFVFEPADDARAASPLITAGDPIMTDAANPSALPSSDDDGGVPLARVPKPRSLRTLFSWQSLWRAVFVAVLCWIVTVIFITTVQRRLVFVGQSVFRNVDLRISSTVWDERQLRDVKVPTPDGLKLNGWLALTDPTSLDNKAAVAGKPLIVYFGGNAGTRRMRQTSLSMLETMGCSALIVDYRSFADNDGKPSEEAFLRDGRTVVNWANTELGVPDDRIILYGESLGGAVATGVAAAMCEDGREPGGLVLRATFASMTETAGHHYPFLPVSLLLIDRFPSVDRIPSVTCPVLQFHGDEDVVIPLTHGKRLQAATPAESSGGIPKRFIELPGAGHNNVLRTSYDTLYRETERWLQDIGQLPASEAAATE